MKDGTRDVRRSRSRSPIRDRAERGRNDPSVNPGNNLHVSGLDPKVDNRELEALFSKFGKVDKAAIMYDPHTRESRGFGFVTMETVEGADAASASLSNTELFGKTMRIEKARRGRARTPTPGKYFGPPKKAEHERPYDPRPYDSRYTRFDERRDDSGRRGYPGRDRYERYDRLEDRRYDDRRLDDRRERVGRYDDRRDRRERY